MIASSKLGLLIKLRDMSLLDLDNGVREVLEFVRSTDFGDNKFLFTNLIQAHAPYSPPGSNIDAENRFRASFTGFNGGSGCL